MASTLFKFNIRELLLVIAIVGLCASLYIERAHNHKLTTQNTMLRDSLKQYYTAAIALATAYQQKLRPAEDPMDILSMALGGLPPPEHLRMPPNSSD
jgi:hypothetical protein